MPLCGATVCGCAVSSVPAVSGELNGHLPTIDVAGNGTTISPWNLTINDEWVVALIEATTFTPTLTQSATPTKTVTRASYWRGGGGIHGDARLAVTSNGTAANAVVVGLPAASHASYSVNDVIGDGWVFDTSAGFYYYGLLVWASSTTAKFLLQTDGAAATFLGVTSFTVALASGDIVQYQFSYQPA